MFFFPLAFCQMTVPMKYCITLLCCQISLFCAILMCCEWTIRFYAANIFHVQKHMIQMTVDVPQYLNSCCNYCSQKVNVWTCVLLYSTITYNTLLLGANLLTKYLHKHLHIFCYCYVYVFMLCILYYIYMHYDQTGW